MNNIEKNIYLCRTREQYPEATGEINWIDIEGLSNKEFMEKAIADGHAFTLKDFAELMEANPLDTENFEIRILEAPQELSVDKYRIYTTGNSNPEAYFKFQILVKDTWYLVPTQLIEVEQEPGKVSKAHITLNI